jgi:hypothetical protein
MFCTLLVTALIAPPKTLNVLFLGNSHTMSNDVPGMVKALIESDGSSTRVATKVYSAGFVEELASSQPVRQEIQSKQWHAIVMQGAKLSSSHKYEYDHSGAVQLAKLAKQNGLQVYLFAEWPRRGWNESSYIMKEYGEIAQPSGATIIPICYAWDALIKEAPNAPVWAGDGNHAQLPGSYLAARMIASWLSEPAIKAPWQPNGVDSRLASTIKRIAKQTAEKHR